MAAGGRLTRVGFDRAAVDFVAARRRLLGLSELSPIVRDRALAVYVGLFEYANSEGQVVVPSVQLAEEFGISRMSWLQYRDALVEAGLIELADQYGSHLRALRLVTPVK